MSEIKLTIEQAVETLNRVKHRERDDWQLLSGQRSFEYPRLAAAQVPTLLSAGTNTQPPFWIAVADALIIAAWYQQQQTPACPDRAHEHDGDRVIYFGSLDE